MSTSASRAGRAITRIRRTWAELDYAQRRLLEIRTGIPFSDDEKRARRWAEIDELEALYVGDDRRAY
jgi:hypothetical protein